MQKRYTSIWFPHLFTDWLASKNPELAKCCCVVVENRQNRQMVAEANAFALKEGVRPNMGLADAKAIWPHIEVFQYDAAQVDRLLKTIAEWCIRFTPIVLFNGENGLLLDISGCAHLWGGEQKYVKNIVDRFGKRGLEIKIGVADTIGVAWANARYGTRAAIIKPGCLREALLEMPPKALRIDDATNLRLQKLGMYQIASFIDMPRSSLRRRFGSQLLLNLDKALGLVPEYIAPIQPTVVYEERLDCLDPVSTAVGIATAIKILLKQLCMKMLNDNQGLRSATLQCYRLDGELQNITIGTQSASANHEHLFGLFELKISMIAPGLGIELFVIRVAESETLNLKQEAIWAKESQTGNEEITMLLDRLSMRFGRQAIKRYLPAQHYLPEKSVTLATSFHEKPGIGWATERPRPTFLLRRPEPVKVAAPIPDYPPMLFIYKGATHHIKKADGPERIADEWWDTPNEHRDYYCVEDEMGRRYWIFRLGHYSENTEAKWFLHGYFA